MVNIDPFDIALYEIPPNLKQVSSCSFDAVFTRVMMISTLVSDDGAGIARVVARKAMEMNTDFILREEGGGLVRPGKV